MGSDVMLAATAPDIFRNMGQHRFRQIHGDHMGIGPAILDDARKAPLAAADVGDAFPGCISQMFQNQLDVPDARIDGGRIMFLVAGRAIEVGAEFLKPKLLTDPEGDRSLSDRVNPLRAFSRLSSGK